MVLMLKRIQSKQKNNSLLIRNFNAPFVMILAWLREPQPTGQNHAKQHILIRCFCLLIYRSSGAVFITQYCSRLPICRSYGAILNKQWLVIFINISHLWSCFYYTILFATTDMSLLRSYS
jgi:hypothetical protein